jgi:plasmid maintenance system antidote protein VapI
LEKAFQHATQIMQWSSEGMSRRAMAERLGVGRSAVDAVVRTYRQLTGEADRETEAVPQEAEKELIAAYLQGEWVKLTDEQRLAAIAEGVRRGMSYLDIDRAQSQASNTTAQFVSRTRKRYRRQNLPFPKALSKPNRLTLSDEQVIEIREAYAAGGVRDMDLAIKYGVSRNVISHLVSGRNYRHVGGPLRKGRSAASKAASKAMNDSVCALAFAAGRAKQKMGEAA